MDKKTIQTDHAPRAIGPYSQGIQSHGFLFLSGQIPIDPSTQMVISSSQISDQTRQVLKNIEALLHSQNLSFDHVIKTTIFLKNMSDFPTVNEIYGAYFKNTPPARSTVEVSALPKNVLIEIEAIATLS